jgi:hypothetical protein
MNGFLSLQLELRLELGFRLRLTKRTKFREDSTMDQDIRFRRIDFIGNTTDVRTMFSFAQPNQIIQAFTTYCFSIHNCMYWPLFSDMAKQFFNCWFTCVKLTWDVDSATKSYRQSYFISLFIKN